MSHQRHTLANFNCSVLKNKISLGFQYVCYSLTYRDKRSFLTVFFFSRRWGISFSVFVLERMTHLLIPSKCLTAGNLQFQVLQVRSHLIKLNRKIFSCPTKPQFCIASHRHLLVNHMDYLNTLQYQSCLLTEIVLF